MEFTHCLKSCFHTSIFKNAYSISKFFTQPQSFMYPLLKMNFATEKEKDYYSLLGIPKTATPDEIKQAYAKLSKKFHPDMNKAPDANARFAEINNAYETLHDADKRRQYDMTGDGSQQFYETSSGNPFSGYSQSYNDSIFNDLFSNIFGQKQRGGYSARDFYQEDVRGSDLQINLTVKFEEAALGAKIPTRFQRIVICKECEGKKSKKGGKGPTVCKACSGRGVRATLQGNLIMQTPCLQCGGVGTLISDPCPNCKGKGRLLETVVEEIEVIQGIDSGQHYKIVGLGNQGLKSKGDLLVMINVEPSSYYERQGFDVITKLKVRLTDMIFGTTAKVKTLYKEKEIKIPAGAQFNQKIKIPNYGIQKLNQKHNKGDHYVVLEVEVPKKLSKRQKELYEELRKLDEKEKKKIF